MEQPKIHITDIHGKDWGVKKVMSCNWDEDETLWVISLNFMGTGNSNDYAPFYDYERDGEFKNSHGNLIGKLV
jgi:hypothetical protein